jgi:uncharacterized protein (DUF2141 family)
VHSHRSVSGATSLRLAALSTAFVVMTATLTATLLTTSALAETPKNGSLEVVVTGLESDKGQLMIAVLDSAEMYDGGKTTFVQEMVAIKGGGGAATFEGVPYGTYAVKIFHDENSNGKLDTNFVGYPKEGFGFSNDAMGKFGPPSFDDASFSIDSAERRIEIKVKN